MAGRGRGNRQNDLLAQMTVVLQNVNENLQHLNQNINHHPNPPPLAPQGPAEYRELDEFCRRHQNLKRKKEIEFLRLEEGSLLVGEYATKFEELARYCPYFEMDTDGRSKCAKFEVGLRP
ncbi:hypothetical protein Lal_00000694 [Lupinus albus]|nr:hypothetical protein Lal_00000694 [Lupinus albus]